MRIITLLSALAIVTLLVSFFWCDVLPVNNMPANIEFAVGVILHGAWVCGAFALYSLITDKPRIAL